MKKSIKGRKGIFAVVAAVILALLIWAGVTPPVSVSAEAAEEAAG